MRKNNSIKNFMTSIIPFVILAILGFARVDIFIDQLGVEMYAINQLFFQLFAYISLVEAGVGTLIQQQYYKFLVDANHQKINGIYTSSKKLLNKISIIILIIGLFVSFFLKTLTNNNLGLWYMQIIFMIFLFRSVLEYLMFSPRLVLQADQKIYKINIKLNIYRIVEAILEITLLYLGGNYLLILVASTIIRILSYYFTNKKIFKEYPWLKEVKSEDTVPIKGMKNVLFHKLSGTVYNNTDILFISAFLSPIMVTIYASYNYIFKFINDLISMVSNSINASVGNVMYQEETNNKIIIFEELNSLFLFCAMFFSIILYYVTDSFVILWIGSDKIIGEISLIFMVMLLFHNIARKPLIIIKDVNGLFKETQVVAILEAVINFVLSFILIRTYGLNGVLFATIISTIVTNFWFYPNYMYKKVFGNSVIKYYMKYFVSAAIVLIICFGSNQLLGFLVASNYIMWFIYSIIYTIIIFGILFIINYVIFKYFRRLCSKGILTLKNSSKRGNKKVNL